MQRLRRLLRRSSTRRDERAFVAEGANLLEAALSSRARLESVFVAGEGAGDKEVIDLAAKARAAGARVFYLQEGVMERVAATISPQPVCGIVGAVDVPLSEIISWRPRGGEALAGGEDHLIVVCADVRDPGNLGSIVRSAAAAGAAGVACCAGTVDPYNPKAVRASAGAVFNAPISLCGPPLEVLGALGGAGFSVVAASPREGADYAVMDWSGRVGLVLGNEANGLSEELLAGAAAVTIPMSGPSESLNVAMSATVLLFEAARQRRASEPTLSPPVFSNSEARASRRLAPLS
ncbi:MAG: TrmH family RNA methyltransferase [Acidimicrobiales bacterium]